MHVDINEFIAIKEKLMSWQTDYLLQLLYCDIPQYLSSSDETKDLQALQDKIQKTNLTLADILYKDMSLDKLTKL